MVGFSVVQITAHKMVAWDFVPGYDGWFTGRTLSRDLTGVEAALPDTYGMKAEDLARLMNNLRRQYT